MEYFKFNGNNAIQIMQKLNETGNNTAYDIYIKTLYDKSKINNDSNNNDSNNNDNLYFTNKKKLDLLNTLQFNKINNIQNNYIGSQIINTDHNEEFTTIQKNKLKYSFIIVIICIIFIILGVIKLKK